MIEEEEQKKDTKINLRMENSYGNILKRIFSFGSVHAFNVLINILRGKFVALFLGPEGMGISSLFTASSNTIQQTASLGLNLAMVKEVAATKEDKESLSHVLTVAIRLIILTSLLGSIICFCLSPWLSDWSFGNHSYTMNFMALSIFVFFSIGSAGYLSLLQGMGEVKRLTKSSLIGGIIGLFCGVPLYYFLGDKGIVPAMIILSVAMYLFYYINFYRSKLPDKSKFTWTSHKPFIKRLLSLGIILMVGALAGSLTNYIINIFIRLFGSVDNVGLFQAANSLTNQYIGVLFSALALDYFPRLSAVAGDEIKLSEVVNRQYEIVILIATPIVLLLILTTPLVIKIMLTPEFLVITPLMRWMGLGVLLQSVSFPMDYILIARENKKLYVWLEVVLSNLVWIVCSFFFYYFFGLIGLGISLVVRTIINLPITYYICRRYYGFRFTRKVLFITNSCVIITTLGFLVTFLPQNISYFVLSIIIIVTSIFSFLFLRKSWKK